MKLLPGIIRTVLLLVLFLLVACDKSESKSPKRHEDFEIVRKINIPKTTDAYIMRDKATGVLYLFVDVLPHGTAITRYIENKKIDVTLDGKKVSVTVGQGIRI